MRFFGWTELLFRFILPKSKIYNKIANLMKYNLDESIKENEQFATEVLYWILLTDQWPFRMSYILEVIEDADQRHAAGMSDEEISDDISLFEIYDG